MAEFAFYPVIPTEEQITAHYQVGTNTLRDSTYAAAILADAPSEYLRLGEPAFQPLANAGSLGGEALATLLGAPDAQAGPRPPAFPGLEAANSGLGLDGADADASLGNPAGLNLTGRLSLEAWIKPAATQGATAQIVAHGPNFLGDAGVALSLVDGSYRVGSTDANGAHGVSVAIPAGDLGSATFIHLVGTHDGAQWDLYRNGVLLGSQTDAVGAVAMADGLWAIGHNGEGRGEAFAGVIDEVAVYGKALTPAQVKAHYDAAAVGATVSNLTFTRTPAGLWLSWTAGILQAADTYQGTYTDVNGAASPFAATASESARYYRLRR